MTSRYAVYLRIVLHHRSSKNVSNESVDRTDEKSGSAPTQSDGRPISELRSLMARVRLVTTRRAIVSLSYSLANAAYRHAVLYAACEDGVLCCQGSQRVLCACRRGCVFLAGRYSTFDFNTALIVALSPVMAAVIHLASARLYLFMTLKQ